MNNNNFSSPEEFRRVKSNIGSVKIRNPNIEIRNKLQISKCPNDRNFIFAMPAFAFVSVI